MTTTYGEVKNNSNYGPKQIPPPDERRCVAIAHHSGERCKRAAIKGGTVCYIHGGAAPQVKRKAKERLERQALKVVAKSLDLTTLVNVAPGTALLDEVSRCRTMVEYISDQIGQLEYDEIAGLMVSKVTDQSGVERTVGANVWVKLLGEWSDRLTRTSKAVMDAGVAERQTRIMEAQASAFAQVMFGILKELDVDPSDDNTIAVVRRHMMTLEAIEVAS